jgi:hypothetical protein
LSIFYLIAVIGKNLALKQKDKFSLALLEQDFSTVKDRYFYQYGRNLSLVG